MPPFPWTDDAPLRWDRFMTAALLDPERGYYARKVRGIGHRGDFTTTPKLAPALPRALAAWSREALAATGTRHLIELGPGDGTLSAEVRARLPWWLRRRVRLHLVERSQPLRDLQRQRLGRHATWHDSLADALAACDGRACIFSNEFVDAFPVRRLRFTGETWQECWVLPEAEQWQPLEDPPASALTAHPWTSAQVVEVHESHHQWIEENLPLWKAGRMITIDYGAAGPAELLHRRPSGTLRGYCHHQLITGPELLARPGHQDLTADVCFADLESWSAPWARTRRLIPQRDFLQPFADPDHPGDRYALDPAGPGGAFLVLEQERLT